jgi:hypothetical protein
MRYLKRIAVGLGAIALLLLGLDKIAGKPILPGRDTGFAWRAEGPANTQRLVLTSDAGDLTCVIELKAAGPDSAWNASLSSGAPLALAHSASGNGETLVTLSAAGKPPREKFLWPSGIDILLSPARNPSSALSVVDWTVYVTNDAYDSLARSKRRTIWRWICVFLLFIGLASAAHEALAKSETTAAPFTAQDCVVILIASVEGRNGEETKRMQTVLRKVLLEEVKVRYAIDTIPLSPIERQALWFRARARFLERLTSILVGLDKYKVRVELP